MEFEDILICLTMIKTNVPKLRFSYFVRMLKIILIVMTVFIISDLKKNLGFDEMFESLIVQIKMEL